MDQKTVLFILAILVYFFNIPFGYWRANVKKYGIQWFLAIHLPVPPIIFARIFSDIGFHWTTYIYLVGGFFLGQLTGGKIYQWWKSRERKRISSCLVMDFYHTLCH